MYIRWKEGGLQRLCVYLGGVYDHEAIQPAWWGEFYISVFSPFPISSSAAGAVALASVDLKPWKYYRQSAGLFSFGFVSGELYPLPEIIQVICMHTVGHSPRVAPVLSI